jgi:protein-L-isoaspartate(D-aspartate) O-methyltransferase
MPDVHRVGDLELEQDMQYQQRSWAFERVGWIAMSLIAIAALLGLTGSGWLSRGKVGQLGDPFWLEYERFGRFQSPEKLRIHIDKASSNNQIQIGISRQYLEGVQIQQVTPEPDRIELTADRLVYIFKGTTPTAVTFYMEPDQVGFVPGSVELAGGRSLQFQQLIYP